MAGINNLTDLSPIFVVGAPRSGTTLVGRILGGHDDVFMAGESHFFEDIWTRRDELGELNRRSELVLATNRLMTLFGRYDSIETQAMINEVIDQQVLVENVRKQGGGYGALYGTFMSMIVSAAGKTRFCDDTPKHLYYLHAIFDLFPKAKVVGCIRDPRDFLCSYRNYWKVVPVSDQARIKSLYHPVITSLLWRSSSNLLMKHFGGCCRERLMLVQYEQLVSRPEEEIGRLCSFIGLRYSAELANVDWHNSSFANTPTGIFTDSVGRWRNCLSAEESWWVQAIARRNMQALDYQFSKVHPKRTILLVEAISVPWALLKALRVNTLKRGPFFKYLRRRLNSLIGYG